jgi:hypothetical protein
MLYKIADTLGVRVESFIGRGPAGLTAKEAEIVEGWRLLDAEGQRVVRELVRWGGRSQRPKADEKLAAVHERPSHSGP